jgi:hypothetical protein
VVAPETRARARAGVAALGGLLASCGGSDGLLTVVVSHADGRPAAGVVVTAVPFDLQGLLDSLTEVAPTSPPDFRDLEGELAAFQPDTTELATRQVDAPWAALRDSTRALSDSLFALDRTDPGYAAAYDRFRTMYQRLTRESAARDRAMRDLGASDLALARRARAAADSLRGWEAVAFGEYETLAAAALQRSGRYARTARTDEEGVVILELDAGMWWIVAEQPDTSSPFMEYRWYRQVLLTNWLPFRLPLGGDNVERVWRH